MAENDVEYIELKEDPESQSIVWDTQGDNVDLSLPVISGANVKKKPLIQRYWVSITATVAFVLTISILVGIYARNVSHSNEEFGKWVRLPTTTPRNPSTITTTKSTPISTKDDFEKEHLVTKEGFMQRDCEEDKSLTILTSKKVMEGNGWTFDILYDEHGIDISKLDPRKLKRQIRCNLDTWYGYIDKEYNGYYETAKITATFKGKGKATLTFGNCGLSTEGKSVDDNVWVFLNEKKIGGAWQGRNETSTAFTYKPGDKLTIQEKGHGIIKVNSLILDCN